jgi:SAM-dependent methyltransferase
MPTMDEIKARSKVVWSSGAYEKIAWITSPLADRLVEEADLRAGSTVLDVATGTGHVALAAARRFCQVTGIDLVESLIEIAKRRAAVEELEVDFRVGDAQALEVPDDAFEYVFSAIGVMFAPDQQAVADELVRVCAPGGTIGMVNWVPNGFIGELFKTIGKHVPPPPEVKPPSLWGNEEHVRGLFGERVSSLSFKPGILTQRYLTPEHFADFFLTHYGPTLKAFESLGVEEKQQAFKADLVALAERFNRAEGGSAALEAEYAIVLATKA